MMLCALDCKHEVETLVSDNLPSSSHYGWSCISIVVCMVYLKCCFPDCNLEYWISYIAIVLTHVQMKQPETCPT